MSFTRGCYVIDPSVDELVEFDRPSVHFIVSDNRRIYFPASYVRGNYEETVTKFCFDRCVEFFDGEPYMKGLLLIKCCPKDWQFFTLLERKVRSLCSSVRKT